MDERNQSNGNDTLRGVLVTLLISLSVIALFAVSLLLNFWQQHDDEQAKKESLGQIAKTEFDIDCFPYSLTLCGKQAYIDNITFLELYGNHGYTGYLVITIDRSNLTDDELYWMLKGSRYTQELSSTAYYATNDPNSELTSLSYLGGRYNESYIYFCYRSDLCRYSLKGSNIFTNVTYQPDGTAYEEKQRYSYRFCFDADAYHDSLDCLTADAISVLVDLQSDG